MECWKTGNSKKIRQRQPQQTRQNQPIYVSAQKRLIAAPVDKYTQITHKLQIHHKKACYTFCIFKEDSFYEQQKEKNAGVFGAHMKILLENDGPFTIILDERDL